MTGVVASEPGALRSDLAVPLPPAGRVLGAVRHALTVLREPAFAQANRRTTWLAAGCLLVIAAGQFAVVGWLREPVTIVGVSVATYTALRVASLSVLQRQQRRFESAWLSERSAALRAGHFEIVRFAVDGRVVDLTDPDVVAELLRGQDSAARVAMDVASLPGAFERVSRAGGDVLFHTVLRPTAQPRARFPQARYGLRPSGTTTYWTLGQPVVVIVAPPADPAARRAGTGSTDRPGAAVPVDGRPAETS